MCESSTACKKLPLISPDRVRSALHLCSSRSVYTSLFYSSSFKVYIYYHTINVRKKLCPFIFIPPECFVEMGTQQAFNKCFLNAVKEHLFELRHPLPYLEESTWGRTCFRKERLGDIAMSVTNETIKNNN